MTKYALIIPTFENNIGYKIAALNSFLKHTPGEIACAGGACEIS